MSYHTTPKPLIPREPLTTAQRMARSLELAKLHGATSYTARFRNWKRTPSGDLTALSLLVESSSRAGVLYRVDWYANTGAAYCDCPAGLNDQPCWHAGAAQLSADARLAILAYENSPEAMADREEEARTERAIDEWRDLMYSPDSE